MSSTRSELNDLMRRRLSDHTAPYTWSDIQINQWINDAIADYSQHFSESTIQQTINCVADQREYSLSSYTGLTDITRVEYPADEDEPDLLEFRRTTDPRGFYGGEFYDVLGNPPQVLIIAEEPDSGDTIEIDYIADHDYLDDDTDVCTVPDGHLDVLVNHVRWSAAQERLNKELQNPDRTSITLNSLSLEAVRAERIYSNVLKRYIRANSESSSIQWDLNDRWRREEWA